MQSHWLRAFSITTQETESCGLGNFSKPCGFYRFSKVVYHSKPKNHVDVPNHFSKSVLSIFFRALRICLTKPKENYMIKL